jgi:hypothetical protein
MFAAARILQVSDPGKWFSVLKILPVTLHSVSFLFKANPHIRLMVVSALQQIEQIM